MHVKIFRGMLNQVPRGWLLTGILKLEFLLGWVTKCVESVPESLR